MVVETQELQTGAEEGKQSSKPETAQTSESTGTESSEGKGTGESKTYSEAEVEAIVAQRAQSLKDKELKGLYEKLHDLESQQQVKAREAQERAEDEKFGLSKAEIDKATEDGIAEHVIRNYQDAAKDLIERRREMRQNLPDLRQAVALREFRAVWTELDPDKPLDLALAAEFMESVKDDKDARTSDMNGRAIRFVLKKRTAPVAAETTERKTKRPDSGAHSAAGGIDPKTLNPTQKIALGLKQNK